MHGAIAENRSVYHIHEDRRGGLPPGWRTSTELMYRMYGMPFLQEQKNGDAAKAGPSEAVLGLAGIVPLEGKKRIFRGALQCLCVCFPCSTSLYSLNRSVTASIIRRTAGDLRMSLCTSK